MNWNDNVNTGSGGKKKLADFVKGVVGSSEVIENVLEVTDQLHFFNLTKHFDSDAANVTFSITIHEGSGDPKCGLCTMFCFNGSDNANRYPAGCYVAGALYNGNDSEYNVYQLGESNTTSTELYIAGGTLELSIIPNDPFKAGTDLKLYGFYIVKIFD